MQIAKNTQYLISWTGGHIDLTNTANEAVQNSPISITLVGYSWLEKKTYKQLSSSIFPCLSWAFQYWVSKNLRYCIRDKHRTSSQIREDYYYQPDNISQPTRAMSYRGSRRIRKELRYRDHQRQRLWGYICWVRESWTSLDVLSSPSADPLVAWPPADHTRLVKSRYRCYSGGSRNHSIHRLFIMPICWN